MPRQFMARSEPMCNRCEPVQLLSQWPLRRGTRLRSRPPLCLNRVSMSVRETDWSAPCIGRSAGRMRSLEDAARRSWRMTASFDNVFGCSDQRGDCRLSARSIVHPVNVSAARLPILATVFCCVTKLRFLPGAGYCLGKSSGDFLSDKRAIESGFTLGRVRLSRFTTNLGATVAIGAAKFDQPIFARDVANTVQFSGAQPLGGMDQERTAMLGLPRPGFNVLVHVEDGMGSVWPQRQLHSTCAAR